MPDGAVVYEPDTHDGHDAPVDADRQAEKPRRVEKVQDTGNSTRPSDSRAHKKTQTWGMLMFLVAGAVGCLVMAGVYMVIAPLFVRCDGQQGAGSGDCVGAGTLLSKKSAGEEHVVQGHV
eukprot:756862-Hanusia_phi.AAC.4